MAAPCDFFLHALDVLDFLKMLAFLDFNKLGAEHIHTNLAVLVLRTLDLRAYDNSGGNMGKTNGGGGLVYLLTARAGGTVNVHFDVLFPDFYGFVILDFRHNLKGGKGGVAAAGGVKGRNTHKAVNAVFGLEEAVGVFALHDNGGGFQSGILAVKPVDKGVFVIVAGSPRSIHTVKHLAPVLCLGAARTSMEGENGVVVVIFSGEQGGQLYAVDVLGKLINLRKGFFVKVVILLLGSHFYKSHGVVVAVLKILVRSNFAVELAHFFLNLGRCFNIIPKVGVCLLCLKAANLRAALLKPQRVRKIVNLRFHSQQAQTQFF